MSRFIKLAGGLNAPLLYVPCEERETIQGEPRILKSWRSAGVTNVDWIHTKDRTKANQDEALLNKIRKAKGIWFGGGRQWNFVDSYQNTTAHKLMHEVLAKGGVIGGSSAGASIQGSYLARANPLGNMDAMAEGYEIGLGFLTGVAIDQHFSQRGRLPDMTALANTYPELLGIGLDEASSIIVQGKVATAFSRDGRNVYIYDRRKPVVEGQKDYLLLAHGQRFDLQARKALPPTASQSAKPDKK
jgi:cyanophycinase